MSDVVQTLLRWKLQSRTETQEMWVCDAGYVYRRSKQVTCALWGSERRPIPVESIKAGKEKIEEQYWPDYMKLLEAGLSGSEGECVQCEQSGWGTPQERGGILCMSCQRCYRRDLR